MASIAVSPLPLAAAASSTSSPSDRAEMLLSSSASAAMCPESALASPDALSPSAAAASCSSSPPALLSCPSVTSLRFPSSIASSSAWVLLTGASGFLGSVLLEQLLRLYPLLSIALLMRSKRGEEPKERLSDIFHSRLFDLLYAQTKQRKHEQKQEQQQSVAGDEAGTATSFMSRGEFVADLHSRVRIVEGDLFNLPSFAAGNTSSPSSSSSSATGPSALGLSLSDRSWLRANVSFYVHMAASLSFTNPLFDALVQNFCATKQLLELAASSDVTKGFIHFSSAYTAAHMTKGATVDEAIRDDPLIDPHTGQLQFVDARAEDEWLDSVLQLGLKSVGGDAAAAAQMKTIECKLLKGWRFPNTYALTKWITERWLQRFQRARAEWWEVEVERTKIESASRSSLSSSDCASSPSPSPSTSPSPSPVPFPITIMRPSMVGCMSEFGSLPGFLLNKSGAASVHMLIGQGLMSFTGANVQQDIDIIPVDSVTSAVILEMERQHARWEEENKLSEQQREEKRERVQPALLSVYNLALSGLRPLANRVYVDECLSFYSQFPASYASHGVGSVPPVHLRFDWLDEHSFSFRWRLAKVLAPFYLRQLLLRLTRQTASHDYRHTARMIEALQIAFNTDYDFGLHFSCAHMQQLISNGDSREQSEAAAAAVMEQQQAEQKDGGAKVNAAAASPSRSSPSSSSSSPSSSARILSFFPSLVYFVSGMRDWRGYMRLQCLGEQLFLAKEKNPKLLTLLQQHTARSPLWQGIAIEHQPLHTMAAASHAQAAEGQEG